MSYSIFIPEILEGIIYCFLKSLMSYLLYIVTHLNFSLHNHEVLKDTINYSESFGKRHVFTQDAISSQTKNQKAKFTEGFVQQAVYVNFWQQNNDQRPKAF